MPIVTCDTHKWFTYMWGYGYAEQQCRYCGARQRIQVNVPQLTFEHTFNADSFEMKATALVETITTPIITMDAIEMDDLPFDKPKFVAHFSPLNRRLCLNINVAKWLGYHHFHVSSSGTLWGFRDVRDGDSARIVTVGDKNEAYEPLPDYSRNLNAAWGLFNHDPRIVFVLNSDWPNMPPEKVATLICRAFTKTNTRRKNNTLDRG